MSGSTLLIITSTLPGGDIRGFYRALEVLLPEWATTEASVLDVKALFALEQELLSLAEAIGLHYFPHGPNASRPEKLTGLA